MVPLGVMVELNDSMIGDATVEIVRDEQSDVIEDVAVSANSVLFCCGPTPIVDVVASKADWPGVLACTSVFGENRIVPTTIATISNA